MLPIQLYQQIHLIAILMVFFALGATMVLSLSGATLKKVRVLGAVTHGVGLVLVLVSGFGMLARMGGGFPGWVIVKLGVWVLLGGALVAAKRLHASMGAVFWWGLILLGAIAIHMVILKPF